MSQNGYGNLKPRPHNDKGGKRQLLTSSCSLQVAALHMLSKDMCGELLLKTSLWPERELQLLLRLLRLLRPLLLLLLLLLLLPPPPLLLLLLLLLLRLRLRLRLLTPLPGLCRILLMCPPSPAAIGGP